MSLQNGDEDLQKKIISRTMGLKQSYGLKTMGLLLLRFCFVKYFFLYACFVYFFIE